LARSPTKVLSIAIRIVLSICRRDVFSTACMRCPVLFSKNEGKELAKICHPNDTNRTMPTKRRQPNDANPMPAT